MRTQPDLINYPQWGFPLSTEIRKELAKQLKNAINPKTMDITALWGIPSQDSLNAFYQAIKASVNFDDFEEQAKEDENSLIVRFCIYPNGLLSLAREGSHRRKHDNIHPSQNLIHHLSQKDPIFSRLNAYEIESSTVVSAGNMHLTKDSEGNVKITQINNQSGHYRLGGSSNILANKYLSELCSDLLGDNLSLQTIKSKKTSTTDESRQLDLTAASTFNRWLQRAKINMRNLGTLPVISVKGRDLKLPRQTTTSKAQRADAPFKPPFRKRSALFEIGSPQAKAASATDRGIATPPHSPEKQAKRRGSIFSNGPELTRKESSTVSASRRRAINPKHLALIRTP